MSKKNLTDAGVKNQKPPKEGQEEHFDLRLPGFALRVSEQGTKSWIVFYRIGGKQRRLTLGRYPALKLSDARKEARAALDQVDLGIDPAEEKKLKKRKALEQPNNFEGVAELFIERYAKKKKRTWAEDERVFKKYVTPYWGHRPLDTITRSDVVALLDQVEDDHGPYMANRVLATIRKLLNWALAERALIEVTPIVPGMSRGKEVKRNRVLDDDELKAVWNAADEIGWPFGPFLRVLILTGQRRNEVAGMRWDELDLEAGLWTLPAERNKSERIFEVPLSDMAADIFKNSPRIGDYVFTSGRIPKTGDGKPRPISGYSKFKTNLDDKSKVTGWRLHDLRRTVRTNLSKIGITEHISERVLNHAQRGLDAVYNHHDYRDEKRHALDAWADRVGIILKGDPGDKVVKIHG